MNGWEADTPPVRLSLLGFDTVSPAKTVLERPEKEYPLARQLLTKFYLDGSSHSLEQSSSAAENVVEYEAHSLTATQDFKLVFAADTEIAGPSLATLYMSTLDSTDMDVVVQIRKIDSKGTMLAHMNYPCPVPDSDVPDVNVAKTLGPQGFLRASHAVSVDPTRSPSEVEPFYTHEIRQAVEPRGKIVRLDIPIWPMGMVFTAGEGLVLRVSGHDMCLPELEMCALGEPEDENFGTHRVHTGGRFPSSLTLPIIPTT
jgi:uncharacterized protein